MTKSNDQTTSPSSLVDLFKESDTTGDKYLTTDEIKTRDADLANVSSEIDALIKSASLWAISLLQPTKGYLSLTA
ncbi:hypothetical protein [Phormidesmis priestleyi]|uniref:hypothetical protein n=1 Tax=Phormidesmis priestleyi TaxID=268141 RepID=UPI00083A968B|nr:hypothetical protein [Phormidesmis priestleyi]